MNKQRRAAIQRRMEQAGDLREQMERIKEDEQEAFDNLPEGIQESGRGEAMETAIAAIDDAVEGLCQVESSLEEAMQ